MTWIKQSVIYIAWTAAVVGTAGSLYFSHIKGFAPCELCWYQRILMYPLVIILAVGILKKDRHLAYYVLPFTVLGMIISIYQYLLQQNVLEQNIVKCTTGVSCDIIYISWLGFVTIPLLSCLGFLVIAICLIIYHQTQKGETYE